MSTSDAEVELIRASDARVDAGLLGLKAARQLSRDPLAFFVKVAEQVGDVGRFKIGPIVVHQFTHPAHNVEVLIEKPRSFRKSRRVRRVLSQWSGDGLALIDGEPWVRQRRLVSPAFKPEPVASHLERVTRLSQALLAGVEAGSAFDASAAIARLTLAIAVESLFGADAPVASEEFAEHVAALNEIAVRELAALFPLPLWAPTPAKRRLRREVRYLDEFVYAMIAQARRRRGQGNDLLAQLLSSVDELGRGASDEQLRDAVVNILLGANETTATAIVWTLHCLSLHPDAQSEVQSELESTLCGGAPTAASLKQLTATTRSLKEAMRLYPPAYALPREAAEDVVVGGHRVARGSLVTLVPFVTQRDARWFPEPLQFRPSRFEAEARLPRGAYLPFGLGPRACIGQGFGTMAATTVLALLLQRFRVTPAAQNVELEAQISLHPRGGLKLRLEPLP